MSSSIILMKIIKVSCAFTALFLVLWGNVNCSARSNLVLSSVFSDNMVLQQKTKAAIWGKADPGTIVQIMTTWSKMVYASTAGKDGKWKIMLNTPSYGGPYMINIAGGNSITLKNILIGEVWLCSGQSNMEMPLAGWGSVKNYKQEIADARYPKIRLLQVEHTTSNLPQAEANISGGGWMECSPEHIGGFSSVAYFFARSLYQKTGIPVGLIHTSWGGTIAEAWTSGTTLHQLPDFAAAVSRIEKTNEKTARADYARQLNVWQNQVQEKDRGYQLKKAVWAQPSLDASSWESMTLPTLWEQSALPYFDGIVWFRKKVTIPESWAGKELRIDLGTIDDNDITYFNGIKIGETNAYNQPRSYVVPASQVKAGEFVLAVRVSDTGGGGGIYGEKNILSVTSSTGKKIALDGEWQYKVGVDLKDLPPMPAMAEGPNRPSVLYNAMINPFIQFAIRGVIWYQGESNADRAVQYNELFPAMITDWRKKWNRGDFPFYYVQLANYMKRQSEPVPSAWAELREAQFKTLALPNTGMAVAIDIGEEADIHPKNKQDVGKRLALIALAKTYGYHISYSGPVLTAYKIQNNQLMVDFKFTDGGLKIREGNVLEGFRIAGPDHRYYSATATLQGNQVILTAPEVSLPVAARYNWADNPEGNLINGAGLPAPPFRTDNWELSTYGKK